MAMPALALTAKQPAPFQTSPCCLCRRWSEAVALLLRALRQPGSWHSEQPLEGRFQSGQAPLLTCQSLSSISFVFFPESQKIATFLCGHFLAL